MSEKYLVDAHVQLRRIYNLLVEVEEMTEQLAQAVDRNDAVAMRMVVAMREEPVGRLYEAHQALKQQLDDLTAEEGKLLRQLLNGAPAIRDEEQGISGQVSANQRLISRIQELDRRLNQRISREKSVYK